MNTEQGAIQLIRDVQRKFQFVLLGQTEANCAVAWMLMELYKELPEVREDIDQVQIAMRALIQVQSDVLGHMWGLRQHIELIWGTSAAKH